ncbi:MAG: hypothetical protein P8R37_05955 [Opitutae bacterium]|nr:hypothetical protein [Opitutae bacterium]
MKHYSKSPRSIARMVGLGCLLAGASAALNGALLVSESFDYGSHASQGSTKFLNTENGHNGGTGWAGAWEASTANGIRLDVTGTSIDYPSETILESVGGKIHNTAASAGSARELSDPISLDGGADLYVSALVRWVPGSGIYLDFRRDTPTDITRFTAFKVDGSTGEVRTGISGFSDSAGTLVADVDYLIVAKLQRNAGSTPDVASVSFFEVNNPGSFLTEPTSWGASISEVSGVAHNYLRVLMGTEGYLDEIRIGETYADVVGLEAGDVFATEKFDYTPGGSLTGDNGGTGWDSAWTGGAGLTLRGSNDSLWYGSNPAFIADGSTMVDQAGATANKASTRTLATPVNLGSEDLYYAMLVRSIGAPKGRFVLSAGSSPKAVVGFVDLDGDTGNSELFVSANSEGYPTDISADNVKEDALVAATNYLLVMKRTGTGVSASLLAGDGSLPSEPTVWDLTVAGVSGASIDTLKLVVNSGTLRIDEISMASTFGSAVVNLTNAVPATPEDAYDGFDYASGENLAATSSSGTGWIDGWAADSGAGTSLTASGSGKSLFFGQSPGLIYDGSTHVWSESSKGNTRNFAKIIDTHEDPLYFSALVRDYGGGAASVDLSVQLYDGLDAGGTLRGNFGFTNGTLYASAESSGFGAGEFAADSFVTETTYLLVGKRDSSGLSVSLIPADGNASTLAAEPVSWDLTDAVEYSADLRSIRVLTDGEGGSAGVRIDELQIATDWAGVVDGLVFEEPATSFPALDPTPSLEGDFNGDGSITQADVDLAGSYLDGTIDGGDDAATRIAALVALGYSASDALSNLNLTVFDLNNDDDFTAADITAAQALVQVADPVIDSAGLNGTGDFVVEVSGLVSGTQYYLVKDTDLSQAPDFTEVADTATPASEVTTATLTDADAATESDQAFYKVTDVNPGE